MPAKRKTPTDHGGAKYPPYPRDKWITEIPFDVADWGDKPLMYPDGLFKSEQELADATARTKDWPLKPPMPGHPDDESGS